MHVATGVITMGCVLCVCNVLLPWYGRHGGNDMAIAWQQRRNTMASTWQEHAMLLMLFPCHVIAMASSP
jgi:hypothetical protein